MSLKITLAPLIGFTPSVTIPLIVALILVRGISILVIELFFSTFLTVPFWVYPSFSQRIVTTPGFTFNLNIPNSSPLTWTISVSSLKDTSGYGIEFPFSSTACPLIKLRISINFKFTV